MTNVYSHEIVIIAFFVIDKVRPVLTIAKNPVDGGPLIRIVVVYASKVIPVVFLRRTLLPSAKKIETKPAIYCVWICDWFGTVCYTIQWQ